MLPLPIHNCDTQDVVPFFKPFLVSQGRAVAEKLNRDALAFQQVRKAALDSSDLETSCRNIFTYSECVSNFISRVESFESDLNISFSWNDAFKPQMKVVYTSFYFDWACMVWNLGANASRLACQADRSQEHGLKIANKYFQVAAGAIDYIIDTIAPHFRGTTVANSNNLMPCLSTFGLQFARNLTLAQGQQCFFEKANRDRKMSSTNPSVPAMKSALIAKLAKEASSLFEQAQNSLLTYNSQFQAKSSASFLGSGSSSKPDFDPIWLAYCTFQSKYFSSYAEYYQGQAAKDAAAQVGRGYSEELTRLTVSEGLLREALGGILSYSALGQLEQPARELLDLVVFSKRQAEVENAQVYLEQPPVYSSLPLISRQSLSKPLNISAVNTSSAGPLSTSTDHLNLFAGLFPKPVLEAMTSIKDMYNKNQVRVTEVAMQATQDAKTALAAVGLPGTVQAYRSRNDSGVQIPDPLWEKVKQNQQLGGLADIKQRLGDLFINSKRISDNIEEIERTIKDEINKDMQFQSTYFGYASSIVANMPKTEELINEREGKPNQKSLRENIDQLKDTYSLSQNSDLLLINNMIKGGEITTEDAKRSILVDMASKGKYSDWFLSLTRDPGVLTLACECDEVCHATSKDNLIEIIEAVNLRHGDNVPSPFKFAAAAQSQETSRTDEIVMNIDSALVQLTEVFDHRHLKVGELRDLSYSENVEKLYSERLTLAYNGSIAVGKQVAADAVKAVIDDALATVNGIYEEIFHKISFQTSLIQQILCLNGEFNASLGQMNDPKVVYQNKIIGEVEMFINYITAWREQLINGNVFYSNLQRNVKSVRDEIDAIAHSQLAYRSESEMSLAVNRKESPHPPHMQYQQQQHHQQQLQQQQSQQQQHRPSYNSQPNAPPLTANSSMGDAELTAKMNRIAEMGFEKEAIMRVLLSLNGNEEATIAALLSETSQAAPPPSGAPSNSNTYSRPHQQTSFNSGFFGGEGGQYTGTGSLPISTYSSNTPPPAVKPDRAITTDFRQDHHFVANSLPAPPITNSSGGGNVTSQSQAQYAIGIPIESPQQQQQQQQQFHQYQLQQQQQQQLQQQQQHQSSNLLHSGPSGYNPRAYHTPTLPAQQQFSTGGHDSGANTAISTGGGGGGSASGYQYYSEPNAPAHVANNASALLTGFNDIVLMKTTNGFGIKLVECAIVEILPNIQVVSTSNGNLKIGDILTDVNDQNLGGVGRSQQELAVTILMSVPNFERAKLRFRDPKANLHSNSNSNNHNSGAAMQSYSASYQTENIVNNQNQLQYAPQQYVQQAPILSGHSHGFTPPSQQQHHQQQLQQQQSQQQQHRPSYNSQPNAPPLTANSSMGDAELTAKVNRIAEMGFEKEAIMRVLLSLNGNEEATIAALLSETSQAAPPPSGASSGSGSAAPTATGTEKEKKGLFGGFFSSKK